MIRGEAKCGRKALPGEAAYNRGIVSTDPAGLPPDLPSDLLGRIPLFAELQKVLSWTGGPVNWDLARQIAVAAAASAEPAHQIDDTAVAELEQDARIAELWLFESTGLEPAPSMIPVRAMTPALWADHACASFRELIDPLAAKVSSALASQAPAAFSADAPPGVDAPAIGQAIAQMAPLLLGVQTGSVIGGVAKELLGEHDLPLPSDDPGSIAVILPSVDALAAKYGLEAKQVRLWVTLHETAHRAIAETLAATRPAFFARYLDYVASLQVDFSSAFEKLQNIDLSDPSQASGDLGNRGFFDLLDTPGGSPAAVRLEDLIGLIEATADRAIESATQDRLPSSGRIAEAVSRHHAGADGASSLKRFIGIGTGEDSRRDADMFTRAVLEAGGWPALIRMWDDAETIPSREEMARPDLWVERTIR